MTKPSSILTDSHGREHTYLRLSLTERCNLRCTYCMPAEGADLSPKEHIMKTHEIVEIAKQFVDLGVTKIRLTGGEPLVRKNVEEILRSLAALPVELSLTTNAVILDRYLPLLKELGIRHLNISLDHLDAHRFLMTTLRDDYDKVMHNILLAEADDFFTVKVNAVLIKGVNDMEVVDFIRWMEDKNLHVRFIEFMPFDGNNWDMSRLVSFDEIVSAAMQHFGKENVLRIEDRPNDTSENFRIRGHKGTFAIISTVTRPFCSTCNRIRLTANGRIKNCLFSGTETDLLTPFRAGADIRPLIKNAIRSKHAVRGGLDDSAFKNPGNHHNRSMILIGG